MACLLSAAHASAGDTAFRLAREDGNGWVEPGKFGGSPAVFLFWSADCLPCLAELNGISTLREMFPNVRFVAVALSPRDATRRALARVNLPRFIEQARGPLSPRGLLARLGNKNGALPFSVIYDGGGQRCASHVGILTMQSLRSNLQDCSK